MDPQAAEPISHLTENQFREQTIGREDRSVAEVPEMGRETSIKVTKPGEDLQLGGSLKEQVSFVKEEHCSKPGEPAPSVDNKDDSGIDCTRDPDWQVVFPNELPDHPEPNQVHNDKYWDERSLDTELQNKDLQEQMIRRELESFDRAAHSADDAGRSFQNEVLDPYHAGGRPPSEPPSSSNSLDSFV